jgi:hypothetical protein
MIIPHNLQSKLATPTFDSVISHFITQNKTILIKTLFQFFSLPIMMQEKIEKESARLG